MYIRGVRGDVSGMAAAFINIVNFHYYYNIMAAAVFGSPDSLAAFSLASLGLTFSLVALVRLCSIAWHTMSQAFTRRWHPASNRRGC
jgi:hypothetical protein